MIRLGLIMEPAHGVSFFSGQRRGLAAPGDDKGVSKQNGNRKSKIEMIINKELIGPCSKHVPLYFLGSEKMNNLQPNAKIKKLTAGNRKGNGKQEQQQFSASYYRSRQPRQNITSGQQYTASNPQLARQHSRTDPP